MLDDYRRFYVQETVLYEVVARSEAEALDEVRDNNGRDCWVLAVTDRRIVDITLDTLGHCVID